MPGLAALLGAFLRLPPVKQVMASQQVKSQIDQNIRQSFKAFEDNDGDGEED